MREGGKRATMWGGRFASPPDPDVQAFTSSLAYDRRLAVADVQGSLAHAMMLGATGILPAADAQRLQQGLRAILAEVEAGAAIEGAEDVHTWVESRLAAVVGDVAGRLHTGRSRNDQVATDTRLYLRGEIETIVTLIAEVASQFLRLVDADGDAIMPGYTHLQRAQPVLLGHHLLAYVEMLLRDAGRLQDAYRRTNVLPLGSAALAGTSFPIDRGMVARLLGFEGVAANSLDAVGDRDFVLEFLAASAILMVHLSRWCGEIVLWTSAEFGFAALDDAVAAGSSIMPQKKNPDAAELIRGKSGRVIGDLVTVLAAMKGLPLAYNSDMQEDKEALFDAADTVRRSLSILARVMESLRFDRDRLAAALRDGHLTATDAADYLARKGVPFRQAHAAVGALVRRAEAEGVTLDALSLSALRQASPLFDRDVYAVLTPKGSVAAKRSPGGTAPGEVRGARARAAERLAGLRAWIEERPRVQV